MSRSEKKTTSLVSREWRKRTPPPAHAFDTHKKKHNHRKKDNQFYHHFTFISRMTASPSSFDLCTYSRACCFSPRPLPLTRRFHHTYRFVKNSNHNKRRSHCTQKSTHVTTVPNARIVSVAVFTADLPPPSRPPLSSRDQPIPVKSGNKRQKGGVRACVRTYIVATAVAEKN